MPRLFLVLRKKIFNVSFDLLVLPIVVITGLRCPKKGNWSASRSHNQFFPRSDRQGSYVKEDKWHLYGYPEAAKALIKMCKKNKEKYF